MTERSAVASAVLMAPLFVNCEACGGEGRRYAGHPNDPHPRDLGPCEVCRGEGVAEIESEPAGIEFATDPPDEALVRSTYAALGTAGGWIIRSTLPKRLGASRGKRERSEERGVNSESKPSTVWAAVSSQMYPAVECRLCGRSHIVGELCDCMPVGWRCPSCLTIWAPQVEACQKCDPPPAPGGRE